MISNHLGIVEQQQKKTDALSALVAKFLKDGGQIAQLKSAPQVPLPPAHPRRVDPEAVLNRWLEAR